VSKNVLWCNTYVVHFEGKFCVNFLKPVIGLAICLVTLSMVVIVAAGEIVEQPWQMQKQQDSITVYTRLSDLDGLTEFKGVTVLDASLASVLAVLGDVGACSQWLYRCADPKLLGSDSFTDRYVYQVHKLPFPASDRDYVLHVRVSYHPDDRRVEISMDVMPDFLPDTPGLVRIKRGGGRWTLTQTTDNQVQIVWQQVMDPGGRVPRFLVNGRAINIPYESLLGLARLVTRSKYAQATAEYGPSGQLVGINYPD